MKKPYLPAEMLHHEQQSLGSQRGFIEPYKENCWK